MNTTKIREHIRKTISLIEKVIHETEDIYGVDHWEETSEHLQQVLDNLTTVLERRTASAVFDDMEMDVGDDSGELTLF